MKTNETPWVDGLTIGQVLAETATRFPARGAIVFPQSDVRMNYREFHQAARSVTLPGNVADAILRGTAT